MGPRAAASLGICWLVYMGSAFGKFRLVGKKHDALSKTVRAIKRQRCSTLVSYQASHVKNSRRKILSLVRLLQGRWLPASRRPFRWRPPALSPDSARKLTKLFLISAAGLPYAYRQKSYRHGTHSCQRQKEKKKRRRKRGKKGKEKIWK